MKIFAYIRTADWWSNKLPTLLAVSYATALQAQIPLTGQFAPYIGFLLAAIVVGAIYVSLINDLTDIELDLANGKANRMATLPKPIRVLLPLTCLAIGVFFTLRLPQDDWSRLFYAMSWIVFSLYSFPPVRLKDRRWAGVLADAAGAHVFPSLFFVYALYSYGGAVPNTVWLVTIGFWALFHGLRGILWHQYQDRDGDLSSNIRTLAARIPPQAFRPIERMIFALETVGLLAILIQIGNLVVYLGFALYLISALIGYYAYGIRAVMILSPKNGRYQLALQDFYQSYFPVSLLWVAVADQPSAWWILSFHIVLFPTTLVDIGKNFLKLFYDRSRSFVRAR